MEEEECLKKPKKLELPEHKEIPFLTYGFFKPGQLAFSQIEDYIKKSKVTPVYIEATLKDVNGMPVLIKEYSESNEPVKGYVLRFRKKMGKTAYKKICKTKDSHIYSWETIEYNGELINVLVSADPEKMEKLYRNPDISNTSPNSYDYNWINDPVYKYTIKFLDSRLDDLYERIYYAKGDFHKLSVLFIEVQSLYMVLWSAIDRFLTFRYTLYQSTNVIKLSEEEFFKQALHENVESCYTVTSAQNLKQIELNPYNAKCSAFYYYTLRNNVVHSGKNNVNDVVMLAKALRELTGIFKDVFKAVKEEGEYIKWEFRSLRDDEESARKNPIKFKS